MDEIKNRTEKLLKEQSLMESSGLRKSALPKTKRMKHLIISTGVVCLISLGLVMVKKHNPALTHHSKELASNNVITVEDKLNSQKSKDSKAFDQLKATQAEFEITAKDYVSSIIHDTQMIPQNEQKMRTNIQSQIELIDRIKPDLNSEDQRLARIFIINIQRLESLLPTTQTVLTMKPFWEQMSNTLTAKFNLLLSLKKSSGTDEEISFIKDNSTTKTY